jgi:hypothetical protein
VGFPIQISPTPNVADEDAEDWEDPDESTVVDYEGDQHNPRVRYYVLIALFVLMEFPSNNLLH